MKKSTQARDARPPDHAGCRGGMRRRTAEDLLAASPFRLIFGAVPDAVWAVQAFQETYPCRSGI
jgi:hypothetical protein